MAAHITIEPTRFAPTKPTTPEPEVSGLGVKRLLATLVSLAALVGFALLALPARSETLKAWQTVYAEPNPDALPGALAQ